MPSRPAPLAPSPLAPMFFCVTCSHHTPGRAPSAHLSARSTVDVPAWGLDAGDCWCTATIVVQTWRKIFGEERHEGMPVCLVDAEDLGEAGVLAARLQVAEVRRRRRQQARLRRYTMRQPSTCAVSEIETPAVEQ